jgi:hypothetical protein
VPSRKVRYDGSPTPLVAAAKFYRHVPKDDARQRKFRLNLRRRCLTDAPYRKQILKACAADPLFFINVFLYLVEPREQEVRLFNTWPHQDTVIAEMADGWGKKNFVGDKSREQGASWIMAALFVWSFTFHKVAHLGFGSKDDETADDPDDMGSFGAKIDFLLERLPTWMKPEYRRSTSRHTWKRTKNGKVLKNGNFIKAFSATKGIGRGGRFTVFFVDEGAFFPAGSDYEAEAGLVYGTNCQIWWSTPNGKNNAFYDRVHGKNNATHLVLHFFDNPIHGKGRYTTSSGRLMVLEGEPIPGYQYILDGMERTPWGDQRWQDHGEDNLWLARELYIDYGGSKGRPFPAEVVERSKLTCMQPLDTGMLLFDWSHPQNVKELTWVRGGGYKFDLWRRVDEFGKIHVANPVVGADIALGNSGDQSSNSVLSIWDGLNNEQVGELAINSLSPIEFARLSVAVCYWLDPSGKTFLIWEKNGGAGSTYTDEIMALGYANVYCETTGGDDKFSTSKTDRPGYHTAKTSQTLIPLLSAMERNDVTIHSHPLVAECGEYEIDDKSKWIHPRSINTRDSSAKGEGHGDRAIAAAVAMRGLRERKATFTKPKDSVHPRSLKAKALALREADRMKRRRLSRW